MPKSDEEIIKAICERMRKRRVREIEGDRAVFTMTYAVSVRTGRCYVGYNMPNKYNMTADGSGKCSENCAAHTASTYGEQLIDLVFFSLNDNSQLYNACSLCQTWLYKSRGYMKNKSQQWIISEEPYWDPVALSDQERETLFNAGDQAIAEEFDQYFSTVHF